MSQGIARCINPKEYALASDIGLPGRCKIHEGRAKAQNDRRPGASNGHREYKMGKSARLRRWGDRLRLGAVLGLAVGLVGSSGCAQDSGGEFVAKVEQAASVCRCVPQGLCGTDNCLQIPEGDCLPDSCTTLEEPCMVGTPEADGEPTQTCGPAGQLSEQMHCVADSVNESLTGCHWPMCEDSECWVHLAEMKSAECVEGNSFDACGGDGFECQSCDDGDSCTDDACWDSVVQPRPRCVHDPVENGEECVGPNGAGTCVAGACCATCVTDDEVCVPQVTAESCNVNGGGGACEPCNDGNPCTNDACSAGACVYVPLEEGADCGDGDPCNGEERCEYVSTGVIECVGGPDLDCNDGNPCTDDGCEPDTGCINDPAPRDDQPCDDGNDCNDNDTCADGVCQGEGLNCPSDGTERESCFSYPCDNTDADGPVCADPVPLEEGERCDDGNACTQAEVCDGEGVCGAGTQIDCSDGNPCTQDSCDPATGCSNPAASDGTPCAGGRCVEGVCVRSGEGGAAAAGTGGSTLITAGGASATGIEEQGGATGGAANAGAANAGAATATTAQAGSTPNGAEGGRAADGNSHAGGDANDADGEAGVATDSDADTTQEPSGCSCRVGHQGPMPWSAWLGVGLGVMLLRRRSGRARCLGAQLLITRYSSSVFSRTGVPDDLSWLR